MRKLFAFLFVYILTFSNLSGEGIKGVYSCSSGKNNDKPVTYIFNQKLMVRDNNKEFPYEFLTSFKTGELMYVGLQKKDNYDRTLKSYGTRKDYLPRWVYDHFRMNLTKAADSKFPFKQYRIESKNDFLLHLDLACKVLSSNTLENQVNLNSIKYDLLGELYSSLNALDKNYNNFFNELKTNKFNMCSIANKFTQSKSIKSVSNYFIDRNKQRALKSNYLFTKILISINLVDETIWETSMGSTNSGKKYNCSTIDLEVPEIKEAENSILDETT